jgi:peptidoglycan hydrolase-like protein with peptidoglycan-binding domain
VSASTCARSARWAGLRRLTAVALALAFAAGCAQVRRIGRGDDDGAARERAEADDTRRPRTSGEPARDTGQPAQHGRPPLPATPSSLVTAGAARQLKEALHSRGFLRNPSPGPELDAATSEALRKFQQEEGLAATGFPDQETLRRLDIDATEAYRAAPEETRKDDD